MSSPSYSSCSSTSSSGRLREPEPRTDVVTDIAHVKIPGRVALPSEGRGPGLRVVLVAIAALASVAALVAIRDTTTWWTTYAGAAPEAAIADLAAGIGLIAAGIYVGADPARQRLGAVLLLAGSAWLCADLVGWQGQSMHVRMLATAGAALAVPLLLHVVSIAPGVRVASRLVGALVGTMYVLVAAVGVALVFALVLGSLIWILIRKRARASRARAAAAAKVARAEAKAARAEALGEEVAG